MLDEILFRELEALRHAAPGFLHRSALLAMALGTIHDRF
jgi:hypothetical protein